MIDLKMLTQIIYVAQYHCSNPDWVDDKNHSRESNSSFPDYECLWNKVLCRQFLDSCEPKACSNIGNSLWRKFFVQERLFRYINSDQHHTVINVEWDPRCGGHWGGWSEHCPWLGMTWEKSRPSKSSFFFSFLSYILLETSHWCVWYTDNPVFAVQTTSWQPYREWQVSAPIRLILLLHCLVATCIS